MCPIGAAPSVEGGNYIGFSYPVHFSFSLELLLGRLQEYAGFSGKASLLQEQYMKCLDMGEFGFPRGRTQNLNIAMVVYWDDSYVIWLFES